jgi:hypothetical protein
MRDRFIGELDQAAHPVPLESRQLLGWPVLRGFQLAEHLRHRLTPQSLQAEIETSGKDRVQNDLPMDPSLEGASMFSVNAGK